jgi:signal transduction histidine kinase
MPGTDAAVPSPAENEAVTRNPGRAVRALTARALRRSGPVAPLSRRNWLFDVGLALSLGLLGILTADSDDRRDNVFFPGPVGADPPVPPDAPVRPPIPALTDSVTGADRAGLALLLLLIAAPLVFRRRYPLSVLWVVLITASFVGDEARDPVRLSFYVGVIAAYGAAVYSPYRGPALASLPVAALLFQQIQAGASEPSPLGGGIDAIPQGAVPYLILLPLAVAAYGLRSWRSRADADREKMAGMEEEVRRAAARERARIARDLHDVVTHNVSVMVIQAGAARKVLESAPGDAREALLAVEAGGRAAMTELRHVMGLLTIDEDENEPQLAPQPGLAQVGPLVERVRSAGVPVDLVVTGQPRPLPEGMDLTAYRVVQEALTNTVKHAAGASAVVRIDHGAERLRIEVTDAGPATAPGPASPGPVSPSGSEREPYGAGRGLIGLRERLAVYGGTLTAGPRIRGGWRVEAVLPLADAEVAP